MKTQLTATKHPAAKSATPQTIDAYIADFPAAVQKRLQQVRKTIAKAAPARKKRSATASPRSSWAAT